MLRDDNLIQLIGFDIVELLQTLGFALLSGSDDNYHWNLQCIFFRSLSFSKVFSVKYHSQSHWLNWKWMSSATNLLPPYLVLDFQFPAQEKSGSFPYKAH